MCHRSLHNSHPNTGRGSEQSQKHSTKSQTKHKSIKKDKKTKKHISTRSPQAGQMAGATREAYSKRGGDKDVGTAQTPAWSAAVVPPGFRRGQHSRRGRNSVCWGQGGGGHNPPGATQAATQRATVRVSQNLTVVTWPRVASVLYPAHPSLRPAAVTPQVSR